MNLESAARELTAPPIERVERPALRYFGGKWMLAPWILEHVTPHVTYVEPFAGAASVLLRKEASEVEVLNDRSGHVVNFFRVLRDDTARLVTALELTPYASDEFHACGPLTDDAVENARRFFVRSWMGFGGGTRPTGTGRGFRRCAYRDLGGQFVAAVENLLAIAARLRSVIIENVDWSVVVEKYDSPETVFYVDPPYLHRTRGAEGRCDKGYGEFEIGPETHVALIDRLERIKGAVVISGYPDPLYDLRLAGWRRVERSVSTVQNRERAEVLWTRPATPRTGRRRH